MENSRVMELALLGLADCTQALPTLPLQSTALIRSVYLQETRFQFYLTKHLGGLVDDRSSTIQSISYQYQPLLHLRAWHLSLTMQTPKSLLKISHPRLIHTARATPPPTHSKWRPIHPNQLSPSSPTEPPFKNLTLKVTT